MVSHILKRVKLYMIGFLGSTLFRFLFFTIRIEERPHHYPRQQKERGRRVIYALWHPFILIPGFASRNLGIMVLISQHSDGEYIAQVIQWLGYCVVRGSTTRGGGRAMLSIIKRAREWDALAITPDGPKGPVHKAQSGIIYLGQKTGYPIIPMSIWSSKYWTLPSWDKFQIPKPFSKSIIQYGDPIYIPPKLTKDEIEKYRILLEKTLNEMAREEDH
ncbi:MAG: DUF374 domain-containing protein [Candidatus Scalindua sp. AMX11]|nr:MAG: DUF374 domain-containing protein [Candidatus Scalindua sp.]NOG83363.1 lysophospholipid acyltransferase family protein [Planctomycetota bacterium]RZV76736.1 MAG: DUF374 domain-containing protein [Candidatus Scalindua sp. SCAELEC01]TDE63365.1 MAG: DUF374 domain-containing protein [Candidatus Scalindua sp. AMX11]